MEMSGNGGGGRWAHLGRGQAAVFAVAWIGLAAALLAAALVIGERVHQVGRAQAAADAVVLAAAGGGRGRAADVARLNDARIVTLTGDVGRAGDTVEVEVAVGSAHAWARATRPGGSVEGGRGP